MEEYCRRCIPGGRLPRAVVLGLCALLVIWLFGVPAPVTATTPPSRAVEIAATPSSIALGVTACNRLYAWDGNGLRILDVSDLLHPREVGALALASITGVTVAGRYAFVARYFDVRVLDVGDPVHPAEVGRYADQTSASEVAVFGHHVYVGGTTGFGTGGPIQLLRVLDASDPARPVLTDSLAMNPRRVVVAAGRLYVQTEGDIRIFDLGDPSRLREVGRVSPDAAAQGASFSSFAVVADRVYATIGSTYNGPNGTTGSARLVVYDVAQPAATVQLGASTMPDPPAGQGGALNSVSVAGGLAWERYVYWAPIFRGAIVQEFGVRVVDVSDPLNPREVGYRQGSNYAGDAGVLAFGTYAYTMEGVLHFTNAVPYATAAPGVFRVFLPAVNQGC